MPGIRRWGALWFALALGGRGVAAQEAGRSDWGEFSFSRTTGHTSGVVSGTPDSVFRALITVLTGAGFNTAGNPATRTIDVSRYRLTGHLKKGERMSNYFDCGVSMTGQNADAYHVFVTLTAMVKPGSGDQSQLQMDVQADAVDIPGGRSDRVGCGTRGGLEYQIIERLRAAFPGTH